MEHKKQRFADKEDFILLSKLLLKDNEKVKKIKTIYQREMEYVEFFFPIESFFACYYYYDYPELKDADIEKAIKKVRSNLDEDRDFFDNNLENELMGVISFTLQNAKRKITRHELFLILGYILWCIDNRKHLGDSKGYLNWLCNFFHLFNKKEKERFDKFYDEYGKKRCLDPKLIQTMKNEGENDIEIPADQLALNILDSERFVNYEEN